MSKRLLGWIVVLVVVGGGGPAFALTTTPATPIDIGTTGIGTTVNRTIAIDGQNPPQELASFEAPGAGCPRFTLTPAMALPQTLGNGQSLNVMISFTPTARGAVLCDVTMRDSSNTSVGTFRITGTGTGPVIGVTPATGPVDFGSARVLDTATGSTTTQTFVVANVGDTGSSLTVNAPTFTGANPVNFTVTSPATFPQSVAAGTSINVVVQFNPNASGTRTATINIASNGGATYTAGLTGVGTNALIGVTSSSTFLNVAAFEGGTILVANNGASPKGPLRVMAGTIAGGDGWFTFEDNGLGCSGASCVFNTTVTTAALPVTVRCTPLVGAVGTRIATVSFTSDTDAGGDNNVSLSCTGRAEHTVDTTMLAFGPQLVNTPSAPRTVTVTNVGTNIDLVFTVSKTPAAAPFSLGGCATSCAVPAGESRQFTVTFTPTAPNQDVTATLTIVDNDLDADSTIALTGRGIAPQIGPPVSVEFNSVEVGKMSSQTLTVTNTGEATLTISNAILSADATGYSVLAGMSGPQMTMVAPGQTTSWTISCNPTTFGDVPGTFNISSNAHSSPSITVPLNCTGLQGVLVAIGVPVNFGNVNEMDTPPDQTFTLRNAGNLAVTNITVALQPAVSYFTVTLPSTTIAANSQITVTVRYRPMTGNDDGPVSLVFSGQWGTDNSPTPPLSVLVQGNALLNGFDLTPTTLAFGDIRFDRPAVGTFCVQVTGESTFDVTMLNVTPAAGTMTGEIAITKIVRQNTCGTAGSDVGLTLPQRIGPAATAQVLQITVRVAPANRLGPLSATVTVVSNLPGTLSRMMTVTANSTSAMLAIDPGTNIDFGPVDVQSTTSEMRRLTITNMGQATLDLTAFTRTNVSGDPTTVQFTLPGNASLQPNQSVVVDVTYKPNIVEPVEIHLGHQIAGVFGGPTTGNIVIKGRGIDRNFMLLSDSEMFPATFRNPGSMAPVKPITVRNLGEAPLAISAVMITDGDPEIWQLVDTNPVTIPGLGSHDFQVKFTPTTAGAMDTAVLQLMHDDDMAPMTPIARVPLSGLSLDRMANFNTDVIRLGYTGVGIPYRFDGIEIVSMDPANKFTIRELAYDDKGLFEIDNIANTELAPAGTVTFGVTFSPTVAGNSFTDVELFLDEDPLPQGRVIRIEGDAVFVDAHGGGGCSTGGSGTGGGVLLLLLAALGGRVRRRLWPAIGAIVALVALPFVTRADNVVLSVFDPTPSTTATGFQVASPEVGDDGEWVASAVASYATDQFIHDAYLQDGVLLNGHGAVRQSSMILLGGAYALKGKFELGARMPLYSQSGDAIGDRTMAYPGDPVAGTARGDLTLHGKMQLVKKQLEGKGLFAFGPALHLTLPTATDDQFTGIDKPSVRGLLLMTLRPGAFDNRVTFTMNAGFIGRATARYANLEQKSGGTWGLGLSFRALERLWLAGEMFGDLIPGGNQRMEDAGMTVLQPIEWLVGARWLPDHRVAVGVAAGRGLTSSAGSPGLRGVLTLTFAPGADKPPRMRIPVADLDSDEDGLRDSADQCKFEPEDKDQFEDDDGCPDLDNDGDKIADAKDKCPIEAEDVDGFQDDDGCIDKDNDRDGVADAADKCRDVPEDKDGFEDIDGCPELDNDRDGIPDAMDSCINEPEAINGNKDEDGCPDAGDSLVVLSPDRIELLDTIKFAGGTKLARQSFNVLGQVAATLRAHPEIVRMRVTVHVHDVGKDGNDKRDQELSDKRAQAVRDWIVQWGISSGRVEARGFGSSKMLGRSAQINERVELIILERK